MKTAMQFMEELGLHEGGIDNWVPDNVWIKLVALVRADERDRAMRENAYVLAEREAILELVNSYAKNNTDLADAIRARGNT